MATAMRHFGMSRDDFWSSTMGEFWALYRIYFPKPPCATLNDFEAMKKKFPDEVNSGD